MTRYIDYNGEFIELPRYIYRNKRTGRFEIRKGINGHLLYYGSFTTLEEARLYLAYYMGKHWRVNPHFLRSRYIYQRGDGSFCIKKKDENGRLDYFGTFSSFEDARRERDICVACDWDVECIVEFGDIL